MSTVILGIETSCDETAAAIVQGGRELLSSVVASQIASHERFGGVVPEVASRHHVEEVTIVIEKALQEAKMTLQDVDAVAVTAGPGLVGALLVGVSAAKAIAFASGKPLVPVHHIAGHIYSNRFIQEFEFPLLTLIVSGGHTELVIMRAHGEYEVIGETRDDAVGEAYDKVARVLGLAYPGGPHVDQLAHKGDDTYALPRVWLAPESYDFSFSGLKSAVINLLHNMEQRGEVVRQADVAASFQASVIEVLVGKTIRGAQEFGVKQVLVAGGVAANRGLRTALTQVFANELADIQLVMPPLALCGDNAAMIAAAGAIAYEKGIRAGLDLNADPGLELC